MTLVAIQQLAVSLGLGLLVGLQRERQRDNLAGIRTFPLVTLLGTLCALLTDTSGPWPLAAGLVGLAALLVVENLARLQGSGDDPGPTTEVAALVMFVVGAIIVLHHVEVAIVVGGGVALLLHWKEPLHSFADRIDETEVRSILRLALVGLVVLPLLPHHSYGPFRVLNPFEIWLMVVLIVGISLLGHLAQKFVGYKAGTLVAGTLGGFVSSTATTVACARQVRRGTASTHGGTLVILLASAVVFLRVFIEVGLVAPHSMNVIVPPLAVTLLWIVVLVGAWSMFAKDNEGPVAEPDDPSNIGAAIIFGLLYAVVLLGVAFAERHYGQAGLYVVSILSGLTDMDAITLSTAQMIRAGEIDAATGWRMILVGTLSNIVFKGIAVAVLGTRQLSARVAALFGAILAGGGLVLWLWP